MELVIIYEREVHTYSVSYSNIYDSSVRVEHLRS